MPQLGRVPGFAHTGWQHTDMYLSKVRVRCGEIVLHTIKGKFGRIIGTAEMSKPEPAHTIGAPGTQDCFTGLVVGKVTGGAQDTLL